MNWNKAKTILIVAFILLNTFLFYEVHEANNENYEGLSDEFINHVERKLLEKNIHIETEVYKEIYKKPLLEVEYDLVTEKDVAKYIGKDYEEVLENALFTNEKGSYVRIENNKKLIYNIRDVNKNLEITKEKAKKLVDSFVENQRINLEDYQLDIIIKKSGIYEVVYKRNYQGNKLENDYYRFVVDNLGVAGFETQKISKIEPKEGLITVTSAYESLLRLKNKNSEEKIIIKRIELCYYTDENIEGWENIVRANMDPTWKIVSESGNIKYLIEVE
ncbi:MAG: hypothetical protein R6U59_03375 [Eubacteriales bacterium]